jgi:hypothetical protein
MSRVAMKDMRMSARSGPPLTPWPRIKGMLASAFSMK